MSLMRFKYGEVMASVACFLWVTVKSLASANLRWGESYDSYIRTENGLNSYEGQQKRILVNVRKYKLRNIATVKKS